MVILEVIAKIIGTILFTGIGMAIVLYTGALIDVLYSKAANRKMFMHSKKGFGLILLLVIIGMSSTCFISYVIYLIWSIA